MSCDNKDNYLTQFFTQEKNIQHLLNQKKTASKELATIHTLDNNETFIYSVLDRKRFH